MKSQLIDTIAQFFSDPLGFVMFAFDWGIGELTGEKGPDSWQSEFLTVLGQACNSDAAGMFAVASGNEVGKTALIAWIILWFLSTRPNPQCVVTANTAVQLSSKTWRELAKWHKLVINKDWFSWTATKFFLKQHPETWFASAIPWTKEKPETFAGTHEKYVMILFDEASIIDDEIWSIAETGLTKDSFFIAFGNPTRNNGRFKECWGKFRHRWITRQIDARQARKANQDRIQKWIEDYGEDSDFVRIKVKGIFPRAASNQFIPDDLIREARERPAIPMAYEHSPIVIGVDVARFGDDQSVILVRQGIFIHQIRKFRGKDTMQLAGYIVEDIIRFQPASVFVDEVGVGAGVVDRLRQLHHRVIPVNAGKAAGDENRYTNLRAEMWGKMRDWLRVGILPDDRELYDDLIGPEYGFDGKNRIQLERKEEMKARGLASPDVADALATTFAAAVYDQATTHALPRQAVSEYQIFGE